MNSCAVFGILISLVLLGGTVWWSADDISVFINAPGFFIVLLGTMAAILISYPMHEVLRVFRLVRLEGVLLVKENRTPDFIRQTVESFAADYQDEPRENPGVRKLGELQT